MDSFREDLYSRNGYSSKYASRSGHSQRDTFGSLSGHRYTDARPMGERSRHSLDSSRHDDSRRRRSKKIDFNESIVDLHSVIGDALRFYQGWRTTFDQDVHRIKPYTSPETLDKLWNSKIRMSNHRSMGSRDYGDRHGDRDLSQRESSGNFVSMAGEVVESLQNTIVAAEDAARSQRNENASNVYKKLRKTRNDIVELLKAAPYYTKRTDLLTTELEMLLTFLSRNGAESQDRRASNARYEIDQPEESSYDETREREHYDEGRDDNQQAEGECQHALEISLLTLRRELLKSALAEQQCDYRLPGVVPQMEGVEGAFKPVYYTNDTLVLRLCNLAGRGAQWLAIEWYFYKVFLVLRILTKVLSFVSIVSWWTSISSRDIVIPLSALKIRWYSSCMSTRKLYYLVANRFLRCSLIRQAKECP